MTIDNIIDKKDLQVRSERYQRCKEELATRKICSYSIEDKGAILIERSRAVGAVKREQERALSDESSSSYEPAKDY